MNWPRDDEAYKRRMRDFWNQAWGFFLGCLVSFLIVIIRGGK